MKSETFKQRPRSISRRRQQIPHTVFEFIHIHQRVFTISAMCRLLRVSHRSYYVWRHRLPSRRAEEDQALLAQIKVIVFDLRGVSVWARNNQTWNRNQSAQTSCPTGILQSRQRPRHWPVSTHIGFMRLTWTSHQIIFSLKLTTSTQDSCSRF